VVNKSTNVIGAGAALFGLGGLVWTATYVMWAGTPYQHLMAPIR
jgi:hypothetical protein